MHYSNDMSQFSENLNILKSDHLVHFFIECLILSKFQVIGMIGSKDIEKFKVERANFFSHSIFSFF